MIREEIASCSEAAYTSLKMADAQKIMMFKSQKETEAYAKQVS
jgi:26S proteasome regulatory subunit N12